MEIEKEEACWSCNHSDFNPSNGKLHCAAEKDKRPSSCPLLVTTQTANVIKINSRSKRRQFGEWRKQTANV